MRRSKKHGALVVYERQDVIVWAKPEMELSLLQLANELAKLGFHTETMLRRSRALFGTLSAGIDPSVLQAVAGVDRWKLG